MRHNDGMLCFRKKEMRRFEFLRVQILTIVKSMTSKRPLTNFYMDYYRQFKGRRIGFDFHPMNRMIKIDNIHYFLHYPNIAEKFSFLRRACHECFCRFIGLHSRYSCRRRNFSMGIPNK
jgi:hypothetical protein